MTEHIVVDCRGMQCPAPILEIAKTARRAASQPALLEILADDDDFPTDLEAWCRSAQAELRTMGRAENYYRAWVALNGAGPIPTRVTAARGASVHAASAPAAAEPSVSPGPRAPAATAPPSPRSPGSLGSLGSPPSPRSPGSPGSPPSPGAAARPGPQAASTRHPGPRGGSRAANGSAGPTSSQPPLTLDLNGLRAPQPIKRLSQAMLQSPGSTVIVRCDDPAFMIDLAVWANSARVRVVALEQREKDTRARLQLPAAGDAGPLPSTAPSARVAARTDDEDPETVQEPIPLVAPVSTRGALADTNGAAAVAVPVASEAPNPVVAPVANRCTLLILRNDFESLMAAMLTANGARAQNMEVVIYFSFWGVNLLRGERPRRDLVAQRVSFLQRLMKWMMPRGPRRQKMSKMHMGGAGKGMMEYFMRRNNVMGLAELIDEAVESEVRFIVCTMSMGIMGIEKRDLMDLPNMEYGGVTAFVEAARDSRMSLVF